MPDLSVVVLSLSDCVEQYDAHLLKIRGLSKSTRNLHRHAVHMRLRSSFPAGHIAWSAFCFGDVVQFVTTEFQRLTSRSTQRVWLMVLRSFLRYLAADRLLKVRRGGDQGGDPIRLAGTGERGTIQPRELGSSLCQREETTS
jgi:site-specific recombinase XerC